MLLPIFSFSVNAQVNSNFSASTTTGCAPLIVKFTDLSTGGATTWDWSFGNSVTSKDQNPSTIYTLPGVYAVTLTASNGSSSDVEIKINYIVVYSRPTAGYTMNADTACVGQSVTFTDATIIAPGGAAIATWEWGFGDGNIATVTTSSITHSYTAPGNYPISLIITDVNGCTGSIIQKIVVLPKPVLSFTTTPVFACTAPLNVVFTNTSTSVGTTTYSWNFGDGNTSPVINPSHTYTASGTYNVVLMVNQNGCVDSLVKPGNVMIRNITASFTSTTTAICSSDSITFTNTSTPSAVSASWNFGDGGTSSVINPTHTYSAAGTYTVTLIAGDSNGCTDTSTKTIIVHQTPVADFTANVTKSCSVPFVVNFINTSTGATNYIWNFGDGSPVSTLQNPVHTYITAGTYNVSLIAVNANGLCSDTIVMNNFILISPPAAYFAYTPDSGCVSLTVNFMDTSISAVASIINYIWNFGDGSTASLAVPLISHTYTATGIYTVTLIVQTANGCADTSVCTNCIKVGVVPVADFGILQDTVCYGLPVTFSDLSTGATGWQWFFGDGGMSNLQNPGYTYADTGTYQTILVAFNNGCPDTSVVKNVIILPPKAKFVYLLSCTNYYTVQFTSTSDGADSLFWNFGDGALDSSNITNPVHIYPSRGTFTVTLTAYNYATGCSDLINTVFTIAEPIASYSLITTSWCYPASVNFTSTSQDAITYHWDLGDPATTIDTSNADTAFYTYNNAALYPITLVIRDVNGCRDTLIDTLNTLGPYPHFFTNPRTACTPFLATFVDTSIADSTLTQWIWNFGDGTISDTTNNDSIVHLYTITGVYSVTMTVTDKNGCIKAIVKNNYIQPTFPSPAFTVDTFACKLDVLTFNASATTVVGGTYMWNYGDGYSDTTTNSVITHTYANDGLYLVSLTVADTNGCDSTITKTVRILKPTANFSNTALNVGCGTLQVGFTDSSAGYITSWQWSFGNGANSNLQNPIYTYTQPGTYDVTLIVTNAGGCKDTLTLDSNIVVPGAVGTFTFTPSSGCNPHTVCFDATSINAENYVWDFGDGSVMQSWGDTCYTYKTQGNFNPVLIMKNTLPGGDLCLLAATNLTGSVNVINLINVSLSGPSVITVPVDSIIAITANYNGGTAPYTYNWNPNTGINCASCASVLILATDTIYYTFTIYDSTGCKGMDSVLILPELCLNEKLIPNVFSPNADEVNDLFYIPKLCSTEKYSLQIYNRWGTLIFSTTQHKNGWDGRTNAGTDASDGVYYFLVHINDKTHKGFVHLVR